MTQPSNSREQNSGLTYAFQICQDDPTVLAFSLSKIDHHCGNHLPPSTFFLSSGPEILTAHQKRYPILPELVSPLHTPVELASFRRNKRLNSSTFSLPHLLHAIWERIHKSIDARLLKFRPHTPNYLNGLLPRLNSLPL
jgi:hypothetical protein